MAHRVNIAGIEIGPDQPCRFVAEIGNNHNGDYNRALRLIDAALTAGASAVKFQCYTADELVALRGDGPAPEPWGSQGHTMRTLYEKASTPAVWFPALFSRARELGIPAFSSVFGSFSLGLLESLNCPAYKLAALDFNCSDLRDMVLATGKPVIRSCPNALAPLPTDQTIALFCPPGYPQEQAHLRTVRNGGYQGYSYHGTDPWVPITAASYGAQLLECHFQLETEISDLEENVSLTDADFAYMVEEVRRIEELAK